MVATFGFVDNLHGAAILLQTLFKNGGVLCHRHTRILVAHNVEDGYAALRHRACMVNGIHVPTADILLRGETISLHHILHISAAIAVAFQGPRLQVHHGCVGIDGRHFVCVAHSPIVDNQSATAHALHASLLGKSLTARKLVEAVPTRNGFL